LLARDDGDGPADAVAAEDVEDRAIAAEPALSLTFSAARRAFDLESKASPELAIVCPLLATSRQRGFPPLSV